MPISSFYRLSPEASEKPWNSTHGVKSLRTSEADKSHEVKESAQKKRRRTVSSSNVSSTESCEEKSKRMLIKKTYSTRQRAKSVFVSRLSRGGKNKTVLTEKISPGAKNQGALNNKGNVKEQFGVNTICSDGSEKKTRKRKVVVQGWHQPLEKHGVTLWRKWNSDLFLYVIRKREIRLLEQRKPACRACQEKFNNKESFIQERGFPLDLVAHSQDLSSERIFDACKCYYNKPRSAHLHCLGIVDYKINICKNCAGIFINYLSSGDHKEQCIICSTNVPSQQETINHNGELKSNLVDKDRCKLHLSTEIEENTLESWPSQAQNSLEFPSTMANAVSGLTMDESPLDVGIVHSRTEGIQRTKSLTNLEIGSYTAEVSDVHSYSGYSVYYPSSLDGIDLHRSSSFSKIPTMNHRSELQVYPKVLQRNVSKVDASRRRSCPALKATIEHHLVVTGTSDVNDKFNGKFCSASLIPKPIETDRNLRHENSERRHSTGSTDHMEKNCSVVKEETCAMEGPVENIVDITDCKVKEAKTIENVTEDDEGVEEKIQEGKEVKMRSGIPRGKGSRLRPPSFVQRSDDGVKLIVSENKINNGHEQANKVGITTPRKITKPKIPTTQSVAKDKEKGVGLKKNDGLKQTAVVLRKGASEVQPKSTADNVVVRRKSLLVKITKGQSVDMDSNVEKMNNLNTVQSKVTTKRHSVATMETGNGKPIAKPKLVKRPDSSFIKQNIGEIVGQTDSHLAVVKEVSQKVVSKNIATHSNISKENKILKKSKVLKKPGNKENTSVKKAVAPKKINLNRVKQQDAVESDSSAPSSRRSSFSSESSFVKEEDAPQKVNTKKKLDSISQKTVILRKKSKVTGISGNENRTKTTDKRSGSPSSITKRQITQKTTKTAALKTEDKPASSKPKTSSSEDSSENKQSNNGQQNNSDHSDINENILQNGRLGYRPTRSLSQPLTVRKSLPPDLLSSTPETCLALSSIGVQTSEEELGIQAVPELMKKLESLLGICEKNKDDACKWRKMLVEANLGFEAMLVVIQMFGSKLQTEKEECCHLSKALKISEYELSEVHEKLSQSQHFIHLLEETLIDMKSEMITSVAILSAQRESELEFMKALMDKHYQTQINHAQDQHDSEVSELKMIHQTQVEQLKDTAERDIKLQQQKHEDDIVELGTKHSSAMDELIEEHQVEIETIVADYDEQIAELKADIETGKKECSSLKSEMQRLQESINEEVQLKVQQSIEKYKTLPAELDSLKTVLDIKTEEIKELRKNNMLFVKEVEEMRKLKDAAKRLEHENESLSSIISRKNTVERQLSVENDFMRTSLDRESNRSNRLSLENEQLQWRLSSSMSPTSPGFSPDPAFKRHTWHLSNSTNSLNDSSTFDAIEEQEQQ